MLLGLFINSKHQRKTNNTLIGILNSIPEIYKVNRQFKNCKEFLEYNEPEVALDSLIELTVETGGSFSNGFWLALADCADSMKITESAKYCKEQILS